MPDLECKTCFTLMDDDFYLPRILFCGHTYCSKCLQSILESTQSCPRCSKATSIIKNVKDFPVNFDLLEIINNRKLREQNRAQALKIKSELEDLNPVLQSMKNKIESVERCKEQLNVLIESSDGSKDDGQTTDELKELEETVKKIALEVNVSNLGIVMNVSLWSKDYDSVLHLIAEMQKGIRDNGQKFAAVLQIDGVKKYAKISFSEKYFFIHAFDTYDDDCHFVTICDLLNKLLRCELAKNVHGFLELTYRPECFHRKAMVKVTDSTSFLGSQFLQLCTGELGTSLKGLEYSQNYGVYIDKDTRSSYYFDHIIQLKNFGWNLEMLCSCSNKLSSINCKATTVAFNSCNLFCDKNGSLNISRYQGNDRSFLNVIGPIVDFNGDFPEIFKDATLRKVHDCGIAFAI